MKSPELFPDNPVSLANIRAEERAILGNDQLDITASEEFLLDQLDFAAKTLGFIDQHYRLDARRILSIPVGWNKDDEVPLEDRLDVWVEGQFKAYSKVHIGRLIGKQSVRALCMAFDEVTLMPSFRSIPDDCLLHVPVLAVESIISKQAA